MIPIKENDLINFVHVCIDHDDDNEEKLIVSAHIIVEPTDMPLKLKFIELRKDPQKLLWECEFNIHHENIQNDRGVVGSHEFTLNNENYLFFIVRKELPKEGNLWYQFLPRIKVRGQIPKGHDGTIHKPI